MRFVLCDDDRLFTSMVESILADRGHEVVGVGTTTAESVALVRAAKPDVVIVDLALGFNTDFDIVDAAISTRATTIVFSHTHDEAILARYPVRPYLVAKPDLGELQRVVGLLGVEADPQVAIEDRRERPARSASGPAPTNIGDAQAFYESLNEAAQGDVLVSLEVPAGPDASAQVAERVQAMMRVTDRLLASPAMVRVYLPGGDDIGARSFWSRIHEAGALPTGASVRVVVLGPGEAPADAFDRLKSVAPEAY
ncbi:MAG: hypothetical protein WD691_01525 [Acidimicrobiales bacterium]